MIASPARLWRSSLRLRLTVAGTLLAPVIFAVGGSIVVTAYHRMLTDSVTRTVAQTADTVARQIMRSGVLPDPIPMPVAASVPRVQVVDSGNHVISGDPASIGRPVMFTLASGQSPQHAVIGRPSFLDAASAAV